MSRIRFEPMTASLKVNYTTTNSSQIGNNFTIDGRFMNLKPIFSDALLDTVLERARDEHFEIAQRTHPHEFQLYFDVG